MAYRLLIKTEGGSVSDQMNFETLQEAVNKIEFYREFHAGENYYFEVKKIK